MRDVWPAPPCLAVVRCESVEASSHEGAGTGCFLDTQQEYDSGRFHQVGTKNLAVWTMKSAA